VGTQPDVIRRDIEQTRAEMSDTVEAIGYKADVPSRAKESVQDKVDSVKGALTGAQGRVSDATPDAGQVKGQARRAAGIAQSNPLGLAVGAAAAGFLLGLLVPETQKEHEVLGEQADQIKGQVKETAQTAVDHGRQAAQEVAQQTAQTAKETAQDVGQQHAQEVKETAASNAQQATQQVRPS
jgi:gas vesicle protein